MDSTETRSHGENGGNLLSFDSPFKLQTVGS